MSPDPPPDWPTFADTLACPLCAYDLRGLTHPRCPECGFAFRWADLTDARRDRHPYLFEHAPRPGLPRRRAFRRTLWRSAVRPWRFWRDVSPTHPVRLRRLVLYWALVNAPVVLLIVAQQATDAVLLARQNRSARLVYRPAPGQPGRFFHGGPGSSLIVSQVDIDNWYPSASSLRFWTVQLGPWSGQAGSSLIGIAAMAAAWPWLSAAALLVFQWSLRRARVNPAHALRAATYSTTIGPLAVVSAAVLFGPGAITYPFLAAFQLAAPDASLRLPQWLSAYGLASAIWANSFALAGPLGSAGVPILILVVVPFVAVTFVRLSIACHRYLQFDRPLAVAAAVMVLVTLAVVIAMLQLTRWV